ncbi:MAG: LysM peptidoglycan-binding domain-containing protein [Bacteroides sp.]|nr:LysM peptidoglycan-binding domain-containing protein [Bacteroides sp.]
MKFTRLCILTALLSGVPFAAINASVNDLPIREVNGRNYHYYEVASKETVYSICHRLGISKDELVKTNPSVVDGLRAGTILFFPVDDTPAGGGAADVASSSSGTRIVTHKVEKGQTIYGIAVQYGLTTQDVMEQNPIVRDGLKVGQTLHLTIPAKHDESTKNQTAEGTAVKSNTPAGGSGVTETGYIVKKKETLYSIANAHGVTVAQLEAANPGISVLREGQVLTIPAHTPAASPIAESSVTESPIVAETVVAENSESAARPDTVARNNGVPTVSVDELAAASGVAQQGTELSVAIVLPFMLNEETPSKSAQRYTEFYKGFLIAADSLRNNGSPVRISVYDTEGSTSKLNEIIANPELRTHRLIIAPDDIEHLALLGEYGRMNGIKVLNDFIVRDTIYQTNPALMQANIPSALMLEKGVNAMADRMTYSLPVFLNLTDGANDKGEFVDALKKRLDEKGIAYKTINVDGRLMAANLKELSADGNYTFIPTSGRQSDVNRLLPGIIEWRDEVELPAVKVVGYPEWITFRGETLANMHNLNTLVYSRFFDDESNWRTRKLDSRFKEWYGAGMENAVPRQGLLGFDTGMFVLNYLKNPSVKYDGVQNGFQFVSREGNAGDYNSMLYLINYRPGGLIEKTTL